MKVVMVVKRSLIFGVGLGLVLLGSACGDGTGGGSGSSGSGSGGGSGGGSGFGVSTKSQMVVDTEAASKNPAGQVVFGKGAGGLQYVTVVVDNLSGTGAVADLTALLLYDVPPGASETDGPAFFIDSATQGGAPLTLVDGALLGATVGATPTNVPVRIKIGYRDYDDDKDRIAVLNVTARDDQNGAQQVQFVNAQGAPVANVSPTTLAFGNVNQGEAPKRPITVTNTGTAPLEVKNILFNGHPDFHLIGGEGGAEQRFEPGQTVTFDPALVVAPSQKVVFPIEFSPQTADPATGKVVIFTNDESQASGVAVDLGANTDSPCIKVNPKKVQFGGKLVGQKAVLPVEIISCGTKDLLVTNVQMVAGASPDFGLDFTTVPGFEGGAAPSAGQPFVIPVNNQITINVTYTPDVENPIDSATGQPVFDVGTILFESNAFDAQFSVEVSGIGVTQACPTATIVVQEGEQVIPQTDLHLFGDQSFAPAGAIASWKWTVEQPAGSAEVFKPSDAFPNPTFEVNTAGTYLFRLDVWDQAGAKSCLPAEAQVFVVPNEAIHVELLWSTPNDPNETDQGPDAGADLDLHFAHDQFASSGPDIDKDGKPDPWFDQPFDCFWFNPHPNWGSFDPSEDDDPGLDRDDTDGAGPENLNLNKSGAAVFRVGVHYWSDHQYGSSYATVRVYILAQLQFEVKDVELVNHDMWDVALIKWPDATVELVTDATGGYKITPGYQNPHFFQP